MPNYSVSVIIKGIDKATGPLRKVSQEMKNLQRTTAMLALSSNFRGLQRSISAVGTETMLLAQRFAMLGVAGVGLFAAFTKPASEIENLQFRLEALYNSASKGNKVLKDIQDFAIKSPYSMNSITESFLTLKNFGFDDWKRFTGVMDYMATRIPDQYRAAGAIMQIGQAWGKNKLQMQDIRPMIENGVPVFDLLSKATGKSVEQLQEMSSKGLLTRDVMLKMFDVMTKEGSGKSAKIFDLWTTKVSNLGDVWKKFASGVMNAKLGDLSLFGEMKKDLQWFTDFLSEGMKGDKAKQVAQVLSDIYTAAKTLATMVYKAAVVLTPLVNGFIKLVGGVENAVYWVSSLIALHWAVSLIRVGVAVWGVVSSIWGVVTSVEVLTAASGVLGAIWAAITAPITLVIAAVAVLAYLGYKIWKNWDPNRGMFENLWNGFLKGCQDAINAVVQLINLLPGVKLPQVQWAQSPSRMVAGAVPSIGQAQQLGFGAAAKLPSANPYVAKPKQDNLKISMKIDSAGRPQIASVKTYGDSKIDFVSDMGLMAS